MMLMIVQFPDSGLTPTPLKVTFTSFLVEDYDRDGSEEQLTIMLQGKKFATTT